jgi:hypothetical protein
MRKHQRECIPVLFGLAILGVVILAFLALIIHQPGFFRDITLIP